MFKLNYLIINSVLFKWRREFENSFDCIPKKTVYEFHIYEWKLDKKNIMQFIFAYIPVTGVTLHFT